MRLLALLLHRLAWFVPTLLGLLAVTFVISRVVPADPVGLVAGETATPAQVAALRRELGFDRPLPVQFVDYVARPAATLAFPALATLVRFTRAGVLDVMQSNFVLYERAMGLPRSVIVWKYMLRSALTSTVTQIGLLFGILLAGAVVTEAVFDWPGIGTYAVNSILRSDYNAVMGFTVWAGTIFIVVNLLVDVAHTLVDPRERTT